MREYIIKAGGTTDKAYTKKAYVKYSNGINKKTKHFLFFKSYPTILPGCTIVVPEKTAADSRGLTIGEVSAAAGILTSLVTLAIALKL